MCRRYVVIRQLIAYRRVWRFGSPARRRVLGVRTSPPRGLFVLGGTGVGGVEGLAPPAFNPAAEVTAGAIELEDHLGYGLVVSNRPEHGEEEKAEADRRLSGLHRPETTRLRRHR
jgi:hypothetical protein